MYAVADPRISEQGGTVEFLRSGGCFDAPSHIPYGFVVRVEGKLNIANIVCWFNESIHVLCSQYLQKPTP